MLALIVLLVGFGSLEVAFRARGMSPLYQDTARYWGHWRGVATAESPRSVVLLGSSRTQLGVNPDVLGDALGRPTVQLSMVGSSPMPILHDFAEDPDFAGLIVVEGYPKHLFQRSPSQNAQTWVSQYRRRSRIDDVETRLRAVFQSRLVIARPEFRPTLFLVALLTHRELPSESYSRMHFNRWRAADYSKKKGPLDVWKMDASKTMGRAELDAHYEKIRKDVAAIEARGGTVVFVRMPTSGRVHSIEQELTPREKFWDDFVHKTGVRAIHFEDFPALQGHTQPDGHHLDVTAVDGFSRALARTLEEAGALR